MATETVTGNDTRNPLIDDDPVETAENIRYVLAFLEHSDMDSIGESGRGAQNGYHKILACLNQAATSLSETLQSKGVKHA